MIPLGSLKITIYCYCVNFQWKPKLLSKWVIKNSNGNKHCKHNLGIKEKEKHGDDSVEGVILKNQVICMG
jgi:hypothetical protein